MLVNKKANKKFNEVFGKVNIPDRLRVIFDGADVVSISMDADHGRMEVCLETKTCIENGLAEELGRHLAEAVSVRNADVKITECLSDKELISEELISKIKKEVSAASPMCGIMLDQAYISYADGFLDIKLKKGGSFIFKKNRTDILIEGLIRAAGGQNCRITEDEDGNTIPLEAPTKVPKVQEAIKESSQPQRTQSSQSKANVPTGKRAYPKRGTKRLLQTEIKGVLTRLDEMIEEGDEILTECVILTSERRETRTGRLLCQMDVTDGADSITVKYFLKDEQEYQEHFIGVTEPGKTVRVLGQARFDDFSREITIMAQEIAPVIINREVRKDDAEEKRVELHLHTQMSQMDATNSVTDYIKRASEWGMHAIAVTDHGNVQAFPEAMAAAKKHGVKVIYGMEAYLVDDMGAIVKNPGVNTLNGRYVVFDLETTGLDKENDGIIEIGAVLVENGEILDTFQSFVDPGVTLSPKIIKLTGITDDMLAGGPDISEVLPKFLEFADGAVLCAHNAVFDIGFIGQAFRNLRLEGPAISSRPSLCTLELTRALFPKAASHKLGKIAEQMGIKMDKHHRAVDDADAAAKILIKCFEMLKEQNIELLGDINALGGNIDIKKLSYHHAVLLVKNKTGLRNLYELTSKSNLDYFFKRPRIPKSLLSKKREGLIIGTACEAGEFFTAVLNGAPEERLKELADFYDYLEIQCHKNNMYLLRNGRVESEDALKDINKRIVELGEIYNKPVAATCDVHFLNPEDKIFREILMAGEGFKDASEQAPLFLRTTGEMLPEFDYLSPEKAREVVITNTRAIADMCEDVPPVPGGSFPPNVQGSDDELRNIVYASLKGMYGDDPPEIVIARVERELGSVIKHGFSSLYIVAQRLVHRSVKNGYLVGSRGSIGSSLAATMSGITEVNPLKPHYYCPSCQYSDFDPPEAVDLVKALPGLSGYDMPDKNCPVCGHALNKEGHDIMFETFLGFDCDKEPDIDLNFSGEYQTKAHAHAEEIFGEGYVFKAGTIGTLADKTAFGFVQNYLEERGLVKRNAEKTRLVAGLTGVKRTTGQHPGGLIVVPKGNDIHEFCPIQHPANDANSGVVTTHFDYHSALEGRLMKLDILGHDVPTIIKLLQDFTGVDPIKIDLGDKEIMDLFTSPRKLGVTDEEIGCKTGTLGIPEFGTAFVRQMLLDTRPSSFTELVKISGLSHGTDVWRGNADELIKSGVPFSGIITTRDDILWYLMSMGVEKKTAFFIMEKVRKGKGITPEEEGLMREAGVPDWYIGSCKRVKYLFPKGHAVAYVMMSVRIGWYKIHYPEAFYAASFSVRTEDFDYEIMCRGAAGVKKEQARLAALGKDATAKDKNTLGLLELLIEMYARGVRFLPVDLYHSHKNRFVPTEGGILPPLMTFGGLGESAAQNILQARDEEFISVQDFKERTKASRNVIEMFVRNGLLSGLPETNQLTLFV